MHATATRSRSLRHRPQFLKLAAFEAPIGWTLVIDPQPSHGDLMPWSFQAPECHWGFSGPTPASFSRATKGSDKTVGRLHPTATPEEQPQGRRGLGRSQVAACGRLSLGRKISGNAAAVALTDFNFVEQSNFKEVWLKYEKEKLNRTLGLVRFFGPSLPRRSAKRKAAARCYSNCIGARGAGTPIDPSTAASISAR